MRSGVIAFNRHSTRDRIFDIAIIAVSYDAEKNKQFVFGILRNRIRTFCVSQFQCEMSRK